MASSPGHSVCARLSYLQRSRWHPQEVQLTQSASGAQLCLLHQSHLFQLQHKKQINHTLADRNATLESLHYHGVHMPMIEG